MFLGQHFTQAQLTYAILADFTSNKVFFCAFLSVFSVQFFNDIVPSRHNPRLQLMLYIANCLTYVTYDPFLANCKRILAEGIYNLR